MKIKPVLPLVATCALGTHALAENPRLEEIVVTSSRTPMTLRQLGTSVSVITENDIRANGSFALQDILRTQPGIAVTNTGGAGKVSTLRIRGEEGYRTKVFLDGIDISDTSSPQFSPRIEQLQSAGIQRVEILRGPQGMMYGADAGGVVNITSWAPEKGFSGDASVEGGRYGTGQLAANLGLGGERLNGSLSLADYQTDGFNSRSIDSELRDDDGYENTTVHGKVNFQATEALGFSLAGNSIDGESDYDGCYAADFSTTHRCRDDYQQESWRGSANWQGARFGHELAYSRSEMERVNFSDGIESFANRGEMEKWTYLGNFAGSEQLRLVYGVDLETDNLKDAGVSESRDDLGYFLEYQGNWRQNLYLTAGARYDDNDDFGSYTSWRLSGAWVVPTSSGEVKFRGTYGTGFRAPSLYEIAYNEGPWAYAPASDTTLDAEESEGYDLAVSWFGNNGLYLEAVYFDQAVDNQIRYDLINYSGYLQDKGETTSSGVELIAQWPLLENLSLSGNYTWNDTETTNGEQRAYRPEQLANIGLTWLLLDQRLSLAVHARSSGDAVDTVGQSMDDYTVVDARVSFALLEGLDLYGRVENLFDEEYEEVPTYFASGTAAYAGVRYSF
ncbi:TonB-dependent receptor plug domain-containing protein [Haliea sp. E17]|uniref:TonB-dependent receptor plug domain-containing protein n=1 Tax=Haliea sp. E17 TaxID=3401576 RepID=UPI003AAEB15D